VVRREISDRYLSEQERVQIADLRAAGAGVRAIAERMGRSPSTISRELQRNRDPGSGQYRPFTAHKLAVPGYVLAITCLDRIGHRRLQWTGFAVMALCFLVIAAVPGMTTTVAPFLLVYGVSYFLTEFGPNMTTFVMPSELYPVAMRATGHGISAGIGKLGAFIGVFLFPVLSSSFGLRGTLLLTAGVFVLGMALTFVLPEPARRSLEAMPVGSPGTAPPAAARGRPGIVPVRT
jgi:MFS family permease